MPWVRIDENLPQHPKFLSLDLAMIGLFVFGLCYANRYLTDGFIPAVAVREWTRRSRLRALDASLVNSGVWEPCEGGFRIHDYHTYQPSREEVANVRTARAAAGHQSGIVRRTKREQLVRTNAEQDANRVFEQNTNPSRPVPSRPDPSTAANAAVPTAASNVTRKERPIYESAVFVVFPWMEKEFTQRLHLAGNTEFDLFDWYRIVSEDLASRGESLGIDPYRYLLERLYRDAQLPRPSLLGRDTRETSHRVSPGWVRTEQQQEEKRRRREADAVNEAAITAYINALTPDGLTALREAARKALCDLDAPLRVAPDGLRWAMRLVVARKFRGQSIPVPGAAE